MGTSFGEQDPDNYSVGRELHLKDLLKSGDVAPILKALTAAGAELASILDAKGEILWEEVALQDIQSVIPAIIGDIKDGKISGPCWKMSALSFEGEPVGNLFLYSSDPSKECALPILLRTVTTCLEIIMRDNAKLLLSSELHDVVISQSYQELVETNKKLTASERKYRELSESLQQQVDEQTAGIKKAFSRMLRQEKLSSIGQLAAGMAHEINNPMSFIYSNLNSFSRYVKKIEEALLFQRHALAAAAAGEDAARCYSESESRMKSLKIDFILKDSFDLIEQSLQGALRIKTIVSDLKDFSHIDDARHIMVDLCEELDKALNVLAHKINEHSAEVVRHYRKVPPIFGEPASIGLAILNILLNAIESRTEGLIITIKTAVSDGRVSVIIADNGSGIPVEIKGRVLEPFFTTKQVGEGAGMGLTVAHDIISAHGGDIEIESGPGSGTTVVITFPLGRP